MTAVTYLGENVVTPADADHATETYLDLIDEIARRRLRCAPSVKLTHLGLDLGEAVCLPNVMRLLERGAATGIRVWMDMESSEYTDRTVDIYARLLPRYPNGACVVQSYMRRTPADVDKLVSLGAAIRLCKGAYQEAPEIAFPDKRDVDRAYGRLTDRLFADDARRAGVYPGIAWEIQMLFGIRPDLHARLSADGVPLRVLVPYGKDWYGYFMRRLAERPANVLFLLRNVLRI
jgi:proline dehydrogenase